MLYQIAATKRILWKINSSYKTRNWSNAEGCGVIWHTTGAGKTLTSFKAARPAPDSIRLMKMKREKLHLKDEMQRILRSYSPGE
ncbi:DUF465 domain-containing protein [Salmonella enterica subsp. enterica]|nr:DUF465 domain-containing protein [Salmonella enterica subsp. enterica]ECI0980683.1 DUF465 domain-containing protein [Salmonella enterica subsp. enterica serovar Newport]ECI2309570.1 DUF465 domain-containing protein [Salmonella enterica subsp. enterica serovar Infantis]ECO0901804.1 DUF465 domain-containing protein [Salmonella enterica subsp. enterica serovar Newport]ECO1013771.1 DUF465 domain-containing protein [Salmonella enterica subsp. enterica serovar Newport]